MRLNLSKTWASIYPLTLIGLIILGISVLKHIICLLLSVGSYPLSISRRPSTYVLVRFLCSPIWRPRFIKDILLLERIQRQATKFILLDYTSDYKLRLPRLNLLPLMHHYEYSDILFFLKSPKHPPTNFNILEYVSFLL